MFASSAKQQLTQSRSYSPKIKFLNAKNVP